MKVLFMLISGSMDTHIIVVTNRGQIMGVLCNLL